jgi:hypothetical protein
LIWIFIFFGKTKAQIDKRTLLRLWDQKDSGTRSQDSAHLVFIDKLESDSDDGVCAKGGGLTGHLQGGLIFSLCNQLRVSTNLATKALLPA